MIVKLHLSSPFLVFVINESARKCDVKKNTRNYLTWFLFIFRATMPMQRKQVWESKKDKMVIAVQWMRSKECKNKRADLLTVNVFAMIDVSKMDVDQEHEILLWQVYDYYSVNSYISRLILRKINHLFWKPPGRMHFG